MPCLVLATAAILRGVEWPSLQRRLLEAAVLVIGLTGAAVLVLGGWSSMPGLPRTPRAPPAVFSWAATRFGVGGVSGLLLVAALVTAMRPHGAPAVRMLPPVESLMAVQMYLSLMAVPLMCVGGLLEERRRGASDLRERLRFEGLLSAISGAFVHLPSAAPASAFDDPLRRVGEFLKLITSACCRPENTAAASR